MKSQVFQNDQFGKGGLQVWTLLLFIRLPSPIKLNKPNWVQSPVPCRCAGRESESHTLGHPLGLCEGSVGIMRGFFIPIGAGFKIPSVSKMGLFRNLPSAAVFAGPRGVWHTWEPGQAPALACGLSWSRLHPVLYSEPLWVSDQASRTLQGRDSPWVPRFPSGGGSFTRKFAGASHLLLGKILRTEALARICISGQAVLY